MGVIAVTERSQRVSMLMGRLRLGALRTVEKVQKVSREK